MLSWGGVLGDHCWHHAFHLHLLAKVCIGVYSEALCVCHEELRQLCIQACDDIISSTFATLYSLGDWLFLLFVSLPEWLMLYKIEIFFLT